MYQKLPSFPRFCHNFSVLKRCFPTTNGWISLSRKLHVPPRPVRSRHGVPWVHQSPVMASDSQEDDQVYSLDWDEGEDQGSKDGVGRGSCFLGFGRGTKVGTWWANMEHGEQTWIEYDWITQKSALSSKKVGFPKRQTQCIREKRYANWDHQVMGLEPSNILIESTNDEDSTESSKEVTEDGDWTSNKEIMSRECLDGSFDPD